MPAAKRLAKGVLILSAFADAQRQSYQLGQVAMRSAFLKDLTPVFPAAYCGAFMTQEELGRRLREVTLWWYKRVARVWLCMDLNEEFPALDPLTHDILLINEGLMIYPGGRRFIGDSRLPVYKFVPPRSDEAPPDVAKLARKDISDFLGCNITAGLFRGLED